MSKLDDAVREVRRLPENVQERLAEELLHYAHKWLALKADIDKGIADIEAGRVYSVDEVFGRLRDDLADQNAA